MKNRLTNRGTFAVQLLLSSFPLLPHGSGLCNLQIPQLRILVDWGGNLCKWRGGSMNSYSKKHPWPMAFRQEMKRWDPPMVRHDLPLKVISESCHIHPINKYQKISEGPCNRFPRSQCTSLMFPAWLTRAGKHERGNEVDDVQNKKWQSWYTFWKTPNPFSSRLSTLLIPGQAISRPSLILDASDASLRASMMTS